MRMLRSSQVRELRRHLERQTGRRVRPDDVRLQRLVWECGAQDLDELDLQTFTELVAESEWADHPQPRKEQFTWVADHYRRGDVEPVIEPPLGSDEVTIDGVTVIGGSGWRVKQDRKVSCVFSDESIRINAPHRTLVEIPYAQVEAIALHGGTEVSGGGFFGGGFGIDGAAIGILAATAMNALTTRSKTYTLLEITTQSGELFLLYEGAEPGALRIALSQAFTQIRLANRDRTTPSGEAPDLPGPLAN